MSILLLGKDGQVGWQLQRSLAPQGDLVACGRAECDLEDLSALRELVRQVKPDVIVNATAYTAVDKAESEEALAMRINGEAPGVLAEEARRLGASLVHYSTDYVFDGEKEAAYLESDAVNPQGAYGRSKLAGEQAIQQVGADALIFRTSWVFGARGGNFVKTILRLAKEKESLNVVADQVGAPTPAALIATVTGNVLSVLRHKPEMHGQGARLYHLTAANPLSWHGFAQCIVRQAEETAGFELRLTPEAIRAIPSSDYPTPAKRPANSRLDCSRLEQEFGLQMPDWQPYLARMMQLLALKQNGY